MINLIIGFILGAVVTVIVIRQLTPVVKIKQIDPMVINRAQQKANQSSRMQLVTVSGDHYNIRDSVREWHKTTDSELVLCEVFPDKSYLLPSEA